MAEERSQLRENNPNWRGGRITDPRGYILLRVGADHHLADVRGYAYEHRLVAEKKIGRRLLANEEVHHKDENVSNNDPENIVVTSNRAEHKLFHRKSGKRLRMPGEENSIVSCTCGCGIQLPMFDSNGRYRKFLSGHNLRKYKGR